MHRTLVALAGGGLITAACASTGQAGHGVIPVAADAPADCRLADKWVAGPLLTGLQFPDSLIDRYSCFDPAFDEVVNRPFLGLRVG